MTAALSSRQFWIDEPGRGRILSATLDERQDDEVLVRTLWSGISRGTESLVFRGEVPPSQYRAMRAPFQEGQFPAPVKYGYMSVGRVEAGSDALVGRTVFCLYPHQDVYHVPAAAVVVVPEDVPSDRAVLAANMETAINAVWDGRATVGDRLAVVGGGVVGLLVAWLCHQLPGASVVLVDPNPARRRVADSLGLDLREDTADVEGCDVVFHASGQPEGLRAALEIAGQEGVVVELSWFGSRSVALPLGERFHPARLAIKSSQVGTVPPERAPRWDRTRRLGLALELLRDDALSVLVSGVSDFDDLPDVLDRLSREPGETLCHCIRYVQP